ncbi:hypothetical protein CISG_06114 [Coccidioides immitis RMSCC 3703]|uniref:Uncharacterized protein n=1 Tax=Coccidioides immitis RMSCC 3703 TaxID=454286 RepID=A0A0J8QXD2_COCIT|nr:hypothetical protein CISG_06114 [Coccidioides immitis RMSCC 3703]
MMHSSRTFNDFPRSTPSLTLPSLTPTRIPRQIYDELNSSPTNYGGVLQALFTLAIRASRDSVCWFEDCWEEFGRRGLAELLIPVGRVLALAYAAAGREDEATDLLSKIWNGAAPFGWSAPHATKGTRFSLTSGRQERRPTLYPLGKSILQLTCAKDGDNQQMEEELRELQPRYDKLQTAVIKGVDMYLDTASYNDVSGDLRLHGFWFSDDMIFRRELRKQLENAGAKILEKEWPIRRNSLSILNYYQKHRQQDKVIGFYLDCLHLHSGLPILCTTSGSEFGATEWAAGMGAMMNA